MGSGLGWKDVVSAPRQREKETTKRLNTSAIQSMRKRNTYSNEHQFEPVLREGLTKGRISCTSLGSTNGTERTAKWIRR
jgi:hypothetical protein